MATAPPMPPEPRAARPVALLVAGFVSAVVLLRLALDGIQPYGTDAAEYIEHTARLRALELAREGGRGPWALLVDADANFPAALHLLTLPFGAVLGHGPKLAAATGTLWMLLLAATVGAVARLLRPGTGAGAAAFAGTLLLPAVHGAATRYYYDLPMVALLWAMTAVLLATHDRRPLLGGLGAGLLFFLACVVKWAALPYGAVMALAALLASRWGDRASARSLPAGRLPALLLAAAVPALLVWLYMRGIEGVSSFGHQAHITVPDAQGAERGEAGDLGVLVGLLPGLWERLRWVTPGFYLARGVATVLSPALAVLALGFGLLALRREPRTLLLPALVLAGHFAFLVLVVPVLDDRFLLPGAPAVALAAALGWSTLRAPLRRRAAIAGLALGALVALDFHFAPRTPLTAELVLIHAPETRSARWAPRTALRGLGAGSSLQHRGWVRGDEQEPAREALREALWTTTRACRPALCVGADIDRGALHPRGDHEWWRARAALAALDDPGVTVSLVPVCGEAARGAPECEADLLVEAVPPGGPPRLPLCVVDAAGWTLWTELADPEGGPGLALWQRRDAPACGATPSGR